MNVISFRLTQHAVRKAQIVEVFDGERFVASIYPDEGSMRVVSAHVAALDVDEAVVPAFTFAFRPDTPK